jgi:hypothetical protein
MIAYGDRLGPAIAANVRLQHPPGSPQRLFQVPHPVPRLL